MSDKMQLDAMEAIGDRSHPSVTRQDLAQFYMRRNAQLQHKKYKLLTRWANIALTARKLDEINPTFDKAIGVLQAEQDSCTSRLERLLPDDRYDKAEDVSRPSPMAKTSDEDTTNLYIESKLKSVNSAIKQDDFEVFLRVKTYQNKVNRLAKKVIHNIKWLPYLNRYDIWKESRKMIAETRARQTAETRRMFLHVAEDIKHKLEALGITEEKAISAVTDRHTYHLRGNGFVPRYEQVVTSHLCDTKAPFMLFASNIELKLKLIDICEGYKELSCHQLDIDQGTQFTYQL